MKKIKLFLTTILLSSALFAQQYKIDSVDYNITGMTWEYSLEKNIKIDKKRIFTSEADFMSYFKDLQQRFYNERNFEKSSLDFTIDKENEDGLCLVHIVVHTVDSHHMLMVPYPKYNSNDGLNLKIKLKDTNFLGSMETLSSDISFEIKENEDEDTQYKYGLSLDFAIPFPVGPFDAKWVNSWGASYTVGEDSAEWNATTGVVFTLPFDNYSLEWTFKQSTARDRSKENVLYGDDTYFTEMGMFAIPITLQEIDNWGKVIYTPFVSATYNWDFDGIDKNNKDLASPIYKVGHGIKTERINWIENFRRGLSLSFDQSIGYNTERSEIMPFVSAESKIFLAFKYLGMCMNTYAFASKNSNTKIGARLRGIKDDQYYNTDIPEIDSQYSTRPDSGFVVNMDMPFHIYTFDFDNSKIFHFLRVFNCELQIAPFFDFAWIRNKATGTNFFYKDGFYSGGLEVLVYPQKWRSLVVRGSVGLDLSRTVMPSRLIRKDWRENCSKYEVMIGVGLHY